MNETTRTNTSPSLTPPDAATAKAERIARAARRNAAERAVFYARLNQAR